MGRDNFTTDLRTVRLHGMLARTQRRFDQARQMVADHMGTAPRSYVSWSGGKDSTAVCLLAAEVAPDVPMVHRSHGVDYPEVIEYCADLAGARSWVYHLAVCNTAEDYVRLLVSATDEMPWAGRHAANMAAIGYEPDGMLYGLRCDESHDRRVLLASHHGTWAGKHGLTTAPCWNWSGLDVAAFLDLNDVSPCPIYARLEALGAPPGALRVGFVVGGGGARMGRYVWLKHGWPDLYAEALALCPWIADVS